MYAGQQHPFIHQRVGDQLTVSRQAAERYRQVTAAAEARRQRAVERRAARARRRGEVVAAA